MNRPRYSLLYGIGFAALAALTLIAIAPHIEPTLVADFAPYTIFSAGLIVGLFVGASALFDRLSHEESSVNVASASNSVGLSRVRAFLARQLSPMSGGHRIAGSGFGRAGFGRI